MQCIFSQWLSSQTWTWTVLFLYSNSVILIKDLVL
jgi:hypothetical protein